ncbi:hypothetical protein QAD02_001423 [Eretmocerus hayati]|uniref:Uncharacterized protein n=1 Tax=Eretmocerus hayati TaxID=131215 RepID=A0ACC2NFZ6_9HYME|nr:hypothetical protein QAD02_001423 [Eretmocerus hayati]
MDVVVDNETCDCERRAYDITNDLFQRGRVECLRSAFRKFCEDRRSLHLYENIAEEFCKEHRRDVELLSYNKNLYEGTSQISLSQGPKTLSPADLAEACILEEFLRWYEKKHPEFLTQVRMKGAQLNLLARTYERM